MAYLKCHDPVRGTTTDIAMRKPLIDDETMAAVTSVVPQLWTMALAALGLIVIFTLGFFHIVRRQKSRLPIPYGIAISAARSASNSRSRRASRAGTWVRSSRSQTRSCSATL